MLNFNDAPEQNTNFGLIPDNTPAFVMLNIRAGGQNGGPNNDGPGNGWFSKRTNDQGNSHWYLDCEFTVVGGDFDKRKMWSEQIVVGNGSDGHTKAENITRAMLRGIIEAVQGVHPKDATPEAQAKRAVPGYHWFQLKKFPVMIGVEKGKLKPGQPPNGEKYDDKNVPRFVITPDKPEYVHPGAQEPDAAPTPVVTQRQQSGGSAGGASGGWQGQGGGAAPQAANTSYQPQQAAAGAAPSWAQ